MNMIFYWAVIQFKSKPYNASSRGPVPARGLEISEVISFDLFLQKLDQWVL